MVTEKMIEAARDKFKELAGIQIYLPGEGTLDDFEQGRYAALVASLEAALSTDADPVAFKTPHFEKNINGKLVPIIVPVESASKPSADWNWTPLYDRPPQPAPSVAVKPLEWREDWGGSDDDIVGWVADTPWGRVFASVAGYRNDEGKSYERHADVPDELRGRLQASTQAHYEARIRSALSAQVQDVADIRAQAIEDVLSALTAHELYHYRPKAFQGFIDYARSALQ